MLYDSIMFHNVEYMPECEGGRALCRLPQELLPCLQDHAGDHAPWLCSGVQLRFRMVSNQVTLRLHVKDLTQGLPVSIYFGCFQGGWDTSVKSLRRDTTEIVINRPAGMQTLHRVAEEEGHCFNPELVRVILPYCPVVYDGHEGEVMPPQPGDTPSRTLLLYGSSITHGSLALGTPHTYAARLASLMGYDYINIGLAGSCRLQEPVVKWLLSRHDWDEACVQMGINMVGPFTQERFEQHVRNCVELLVQESRPVHVTDIFVTNMDEPKEDIFREIVRGIVGTRLDFVEGLELLGDHSMVAADLVHPSLEGHQRIAENWYRHIMSLKR